MSTIGNDSQPGSSRELSASRQAVPSISPQVAHSDTAATGAVQAGQPGLAEQTRSRRSQRRMRALLIGADYQMKDRVGHPDGGERSVADVLRDEDKQRTQIEDETGRGSRKHLRLPRWMRRIPKLVLLFDFFLLLYFFAEITDVNWASLLSVNLGFAMVLAAMVTVLSYGFLAFTGHRMRTHKDHEGTVHLDELDGFTKAASCSAIIVITVLATLMFFRMRTEVLYALGAQAEVTALVIAVTLALVNAVANFLVVAIHAFDGSDQVARLNKLSAAARRPVIKAQRMLEQAAQQGDQ